MGHGGSNPHEEEGHPEVSSHQEGGDSIGQSEIPEGAGGNAGANADPAAFMANLINLLGQAAPNIAPAPPQKKDPVLELKKMGAEKFYGDKADPPIARMMMIRPRVPERELPPNLTASRMMIMSRSGLGSS